MEQEFANGKSEGNKKKKKFDYQGELKKLTDEQTGKADKMKHEMEEMFQKQLEDMMKSTLEDKMKSTLEDKMKQEVGDKMKSIPTKQSLTEKMKSALPEGFAESTSVEVEVTDKKEDKK